MSAGLVLSRLACECRKWW